MLFPIFLENDSGWVAKHCGAVRYILDDHRAGTNGSTIADFYAWQYGCVGMHCGEITDAGATANEYHGANLRVSADVDVMT